VYEAVRCALHGCQLLPKEPLHQRGDDDALSNEADNGLSARQPRLHGVEAELRKEDPAVDGIQADLPRFEHLLCRRCGMARHHARGEEGGGEESHDEYIGGEDAAEAEAITGQQCQETGSGMLLPRPRSSPRQTISKSHCLGACSNRDIPSKPPCALYSQFAITMHLAPHYPTWLTLSFFGRGAHPTRRVSKCGAT
jgi:hypothetical protein